jgi:hypothetical protein
MEKGKPNPYSKRKIKQTDGYAICIIREEDDPIFTVSSMIQFLHHDLILLEDQLPWMVLEILFNLTKDSNQDKPLVLLATNFVSNSLLSYGMLSLQCISNQGVKHFVDLLRKLCGSSTEENKGIICRWELLLPSATSLVEAGIKFKRGTSESILDIKFIDGVLEIPPIVIQDVTEAIFRNLISYEQCHPKCEDRIISYAVFLDSLINTFKDIGCVWE